MITVHLTGALLLTPVVFDLPMYMTLQPDISVHVFTRRLRSKLWSDTYYRGSNLHTHFYQPITWPLPLNLPNYLFPVVINTISRYPKKQTILHLHDSNDFSMPSFDKLLDIPKIPKVYTTHYVPDQKMIFFLLDHNVEIVAQSRFAAEIVNRSSGYYPKIIPLGFNPDLFSDILPKGYARKKVGIERGKTLFWNGRISLAKDLPTFIHALPLIANDLKDTPLTAILKLRGFSPWNIYSRTLLMWLFRRLRLYKHRVKNLRVKLDILYGSAKKLVYYYRSSDLFIHTSLHETFGLVFAEAMACGIPIVCADCATAPEIVGDCGLLFEPRNPQDLAEKALKLLADEQLSRKLSDKGKRKALTMYNMKRIAYMHIKLYRELLEKS